MTIGGTRLDAGSMPQGTLMRTLSDGSHGDSMISSASNVQLTVIIVSFNTREMTLACLRSLISETKIANYEIILVDNASSDDSTNFIKSEFPAVQLVVSSINKGFAAANNLAAKMARGEFLLLLNPDTIVLDAAVDRLLSFAYENPSARIWGGRTQFADRSLNPTSCWRRMTLWNQVCRAMGFSRMFPNSSLLNSEAYGGWKRDTVRQVDIVTGCFFLIRRSLWKQLGGFDESFFMYGEEADLCLRARKLGARPLITPVATIVHHGGASERLPIDKQVRLLKAKSLLVHRHWPRLIVPVGLWLIRVGVFVRGLFARGIVPYCPYHWKESATVWRGVWRRRKEWQTTQ